MATLEELIEGALVTSSAPFFWGSWSRW